MTEALPSGLDRDACAREPIRTPNGIQPHGALLVVDPDRLVVLQASANLAAVIGSAAPRGTPEGTLLGTKLQTLLGDGFTADLVRWAGGAELLFLRTLTLNDRSLQVSAHRSAQGVLIEFEAPPASDSETLEAVYPRLRRFVERIGGADTVQAIAELAVGELQTLTGFNRILLYSFDAKGDGTVLAEANDGALPAYLDLRFPASDIPAQARALYQMNRLRLIPTADYMPASIEPALSPIDHKPLDLSFAALRSVSPVHLEYMRNMETAASMSISVLVDGALWGLISCHNRTPKGINAQIRTACDFLGQIISLQIGARERGERANRRIQLKQAESELLGNLTRSRNFQDGLAAHGEAWMQLLEADGAAVVTDDQLITVGLTPSQPELHELAIWLHRRRTDDVFATDSLAAAWAPAEAFAGIASGLIAIAISQLHPSYIMWFRQEVIHSVRWAGDPRRESEAERLNPRKSFDIWRQQVRARARPWQPAEIDAARDFRYAIINFVLRRAEESAALTDQLQRSNSELEAFSYSISHDLRAPFRHIAGYAELLSEREQTLDQTSRHYLTSIVEAALQAGRLVDDLLNFSQMGRSTLSDGRVDMRKLVNEVRLGMERDLDGRSVEWRIGELPPTRGDHSMLRQVWANLIDNAVKYTRDRDHTVITITGAREADGLHYTVSDNGVGFDMAYVGKLFGVFQRLHRSDEYPGTGIGLALSRRIISRHGGTITAAGALDKGATISFVLPLKEEPQLGRS